MNFTTLTITANKPILVKISLQKVDFGDDYTQKFQENLKNALLLIL